MLAGADVLITLLETDAGVFAMPSKLLTSLCTRHPLLLVVPKENLASRIVRERKAGLTCLPSDSKGFMLKIHLILKELQISLNRYLA
ncbi:MAG: hypothetical protein PHG14_15615 [Desulfobacter postgatei]|uniref:hypothetical protein n=1 Tax=Desulfobacter postgatei TaxID=2293 RepID=UPI0023F593B9|nr:hypothetical protein [Desulfobacter postgatei]MDD4275143.1 hypothetical protein [Desulfobacter postgatei]